MDWIAPVSHMRPAHAAKQLDRWCNLQTYHCSDHRLVWFLIAE